MKYAKFLLSGLLTLMMSASAMAQYTKENPDLYEKEFQCEVFDYRGPQFQIGYEASRNDDEFKVKAVPVIASLRFTPKFVMGIMLRPTYLKIPKQIYSYTENVYDDDFNVIETRDIYNMRSKDEFFSVPLAMYFRIDFMGYRRNSPFVEFTVGGDILGKTGTYSSYMGGGRFGFGEQNRKALIVAAGFTATDYLLEDDYSFNRFGKATIKLALEF